MRLVITIDLEGCQLALSIPEQKHYRQANIEPEAVIGGVVKEQEGKEIAEANDYQI